MRCWSEAFQGLFGRQQVDMRWAGETLDVWANRLQLQPAVALGFECAEGGAADQKNGYEVSRDWPCDVESLRRRLGALLQRFAQNFSDKPHAASSHGSASLR